MADTRTRTAARNRGTVQREAGQPVQAERICGGWRFRCTIVLTVCAGAAGLVLYDDAFTSPEITRVCAEEAATPTRGGGNAVVEHLDQADRVERAPMSAADARRYLERFAVGRPGAAAPSLRPDASASARFGDFNSIRAGRGTRP